MPTNLTSPNAIPPRTSSNTAAHSRGNSTSTSSPPAKSVLRPMPEGDWLSQQKPQISAPPSFAAGALSNNPHPGLDAQRQLGALPLSPGHAIMSPTNPAGQPPNLRRYVEDDLDFSPSRTWTDDKERVVRGPYDYVISHPGKDFRAQVIASFNLWLEVPPASLAVITKVVGMLHESSLLVDDVQDSSELRRGFPVAHNIFGVPQTINSANYIYFAALQELAELGNPTAVAMFAEEMVNLHRGQGMDLFWRDTLTCPSEDDYLEMVGNKTGGLFRLGIKLMQAESASSVDCVPLANLVGLIFQIRDDYMNLSSTEYSSNKGMCEDLTEGKFSFPVIHSIRSDPADLQLVNILKRKTTDVQVKRYAVKYMEDKGSFQYTRDVLAVLIERARKLTAEMDGGSGKGRGIQQILDKMVVS